MTHYNKTLATLLAALLGGLGAHRFYLGGWRDWLGWLHLASAALSALLYSSHKPGIVMFSLSPLIVSILLGQLQALVLGLMSDQKWDLKYNPQSGQQSNSKWPLALILVATMAFGSTGLMAAWARLMDLLLTGGAFG
jgi:TM2 domain-containing membrane protein YozV